MNRNIERIFIAFVAGCSLAVTIAHSINILLCLWLPYIGHTSSILITCEVIFVSLSFAICQLTFRQLKFVPYCYIILPVIGALSSAVLGNGFGTGSITAIVIGIIQVYAANTIFSKLPSALDNALAMYPLRSFSWAILGVILVIQTGRLGTYMEDPSFDWWLTTHNEFWTKHMCMPAYIQAADYNRQHEVNVYDERHYPAITRNARVHLKVERMDAFVGDPFQYPPQFLLAPSVAIWLTNDFLTMRTVWYSLQVLGFVLVSFLLALWIRNEAGWTPMLLIPVIWCSVPAMQCFQYGQFHLAAIVLAIGGVLAFERERNALGGILLAVSILSKMFPAILLIYLAVQRRWKPLIWTIGAAGILTLSSLFIVGTNPFIAFANYQIPRLLGGDAFTAFTKEWPEFRQMYIANVISLYGVVFKLQELGIGGMSNGLALWIMRIYAFIILYLAIVAGKANGSRLNRACIWLALLNLAALQTSLAWGDYVTVGSVWLLSLLTGQKFGKNWQKLLLGLCWVFTVLNLGIVPILNLPSVMVMIVLTIIVSFLLHLLNAWVILRIELRSEIIEII